MKINGLDIKKYGAKQLTVDISTSSISNNSEYNINALLPMFLDGNISFKNIDVCLLFKGNSRDEILENISNLISELLGVVTLNLDGYTNLFNVVLNDTNTEKTKSKYAYKKVLNFIGYEYKEEVTEEIDRFTSKIIDINVNGNLTTPAIIEIIPTIDLVDITIEGLADDPIIIKNLTADKKVIVDGELQKVTVDGVNKYGDTDMWDFPRLKPGANTIIVNKNNCDIKIKYKPRYI
ncbi:phage tail protein [Clostridium sp.]|jgi:hypothetical protein|uniref:phage distal tail protein n=1 Tax=Clostridium sp. TaxID=1506 RepID=UPI0035225F28